MRGKIISILLCVFMAFGMSGCALFEHDYERDYRQVVAKIVPITETRTVTYEKDGETVTEEITATTPERLIYKSQLISLANANLKNLMESYSMTLEEAVDQIVEQLVLQNLLLNEVHFLIEFKEIKWESTEKNELKRAVYDSIDSELAALRKEIRREQGESVSGDSEDTEQGETSTTYPVPEEEEPDDVRDAPDYVWTPERGRLPGANGTDTEISLDIEALNRFIELLKENAEADFRVTAADKKKFEADFKTIDAIKASGDKDWVYKLYCALGDLYVVDWTIGQNVSDNYKIGLLQEYLTDSASVSDKQVQDYYDSLLESQTSSFADPSTYNAAITATDATDPVLYYASDKYLFVKHILIPFSDEQKAEYEAFKKTSPTEDSLKAYRNDMVNGIVAYAHKDGEDDLSRKYSASEIFEEVKNTMTRYQVTPREAERKFDEFIYKYNTDPGIFGNAKGYAVAYKLDEGENETYMVEFAEAARAFRDEGYSIGQVYDEMVVTDYGVHIMYYAGETSQGRKMALTDFETPGSDKTYYDIIKDSLLTSLQNKIFNDWQNNRINYYEKLEGDKQVIFRYEKTYADLKKS